MKARVISFTIALVVLTGCSVLFGSPSATVKAFMAAADKGDVNAMTKLFSSKALKEHGEEKVKTDNKNFAELHRSVRTAGGVYSMTQLTETKTGDTARISFIYQRQDKTDSLKFVFDLSKENGVWKIDEVGGAEKEEHGASDQPSPSRTSEVPPPSPPPATNASPGGSVQKPISAGVLNGKATSLPKPPYPPAARAAKAGGTVIVQVTVDEQGTVTSAHAISGHPLLRAAAQSAAYNAKFSPTVLSGKPVKITGVITYNFTPE